ncbi:hypothetical protein LSH36_916g00023 [Paralvinella palmiformis]|uniref:Uncharacterized protein n=1 Tax=Paralvinella palmiformis TaxID=53620 RepID=A0AAD9IYQ5_9ANNE|nr:hypothetical protein LSH36_916g00023 [Paralvinella palmiformis]
MADPEVFKLIPFKGKYTCKSSAGRITHLISVRKEGLVVEPGKEKELEEEDSEKMSCSVPSVDDTGCCNWTPQRAVEQDFLRKNPFISSFKHLWVYSFVALTAGVLVAVFAQQLFLIYMMVTTLFLLPLCTAITSYTPRLRRVSPNTLLSYRDNILGSVENISDLTWQELALLIQPNISIV